MNRSELEKLRQSQLIELLLLKKEKKKPEIIHKPTKEKKKPVIIRKPTKKSYLLDEPIPEKEIPIGQKILKPSMVNKIKNVVKWGKKQVDNWGEWLMKGVKWGMKYVENLGENLGEWFMKVDVPRDDELNKTELTKQYEIIQIGEKSNKKFTTFFDIFKVEPHQSTEIDFGTLLLEIANRVIKKRGLKDGDKIRWILSHHNQWFNYSE